MRMRSPPTRPSAVLVHWHMLDNGCKASDDAKPNPSPRFLAPIELTDSLVAKGDLAPYSRRALPGVCEGFQVPSLT